MKNLFVLALVLGSLSSTAALADTYVHGYTRKDGTYVNGHYRSDPDNSYNNNYSVRGNTNPYTGEAGTKSPTYNDQTPYENRKDYGSSGYNKNTYGN